jgi:hypothetical protein
MTKNCTSAKCCDTPGNARFGGLAGIAVASLHHVYHALSNQIPENIPAHVLGEMAAGAFGGVIVFAVVSAVCNRIKARP